MRVEFLFTRSLIYFTYQKGEVFLIDDVEAVERVEAELDAFVLKRHREREKVNAEEEAWKESTRRVNERRRERNRELWCAYYLDQAERLEKTAASLAAQYRAKAQALAGDHTDNERKGAIHNG